MGGKPKKTNSSVSKASKKSSSKEKGDKKLNKSSKSIKSNKSKDKSKDKGKSKAKEKSKDKIKPIEVKDLKDEIIISDNNINNPIFTPLIPGLNQNQNQLPKEKEQCEGCFNNEGCLFCVDCGKLYCKICDDQLHVVPAYSHHERVAIENFKEFKLPCYHHNLPLRRFCETCNEPICTECQKIGPHNTPMHECCSLFIIYRKYFDICQKFVNNELKTKAQKINEIMKILNNEINNNRKKAEDMLHSVNLEFESIINKIEEIDGKKKAVLNYNAAEIQKDIFNINNLFNYFEQLQNNGFSYSDNLQGFDNSSEDKIIDFLLQYKSLTDFVEHLISKPIKRLLSKIEEKNLLEWPKEINDSQDKLNNYAKYKKILKIKDDIIWKLLTTPYESQNNDLVSYEEKSKKEIDEWNKLIDKYKLEINKYNLVCSFCGCMLIQGMNELSCPLNLPNKKFENRKISIEEPPLSFIGNKRHYFAPPTVEYQKKIEKGELFDYNNVIREWENKESGLNMDYYENLIKQKVQIIDNDNNNINSKVPSYLKDWTYKIAKRIETEQINFYQLLSDYDKNNTGYITFPILLAAFGQLNLQIGIKEKESLERFIQLAKININKIKISDFISNFNSDIIKEKITKRDEEMSIPPYNDYSQKQFIYSGNNNTIPFVNIQGNTDYSNNQQSFGSQNMTYGQLTNNLGQTY